MSEVAAPVQPENRAAGESRGRAASAIRPPLDRLAPSTVNALTVDLEDWYHVCGAGDLSAPPAGMTTRVA
jgi:hypothetical protein